MTKLTIKGTILISLVMLLISLPTLTVTAQANEQIISSETIWLNESESIEFQISKVTILRGTTETYRKKGILKKDGVSQCAIVVTASFDINYGSNVRCISTSSSGEIYVNSWSVENMASSSNNSDSNNAYATATGEYIKRFIGIPVQISPATVTLKCDKNGNVS